MGEIPLGIPDIKQPKQHQVASLGCVAQLAPPPDWMAQADGCFKHHFSGLNRHLSCLNPQFGTWNPEFLFRQRATSGLPGDRMGQAREAETQTTPRSSTVKATKKALGIHGNWHFFGDGDDDDDGGGGGDGDDGDGN